MTLKELLKENRESIVERWFEDVLATYPGDSPAAFRRQRDPFANPVGHRLREGTRGVFDALLEGVDRGGPDIGKIRQSLQEIIQIRAVQHVSPSEAIGFVFRLKESIRAELGQALGDPRLSSELAELDGQIDQAGLAAFDTFVECRERVYELRVNEMKRTVSWVVERMNKRGSDPELARVDMK